jgi:glycosyltransferase involved in cell wall biosynthesis
LKICFLDESLFARGSDAVNGVRVQCLALAREFTARGHEAFFVSGSHFERGADVPREREGIPVFAFRRPDRLPFLGARAASRAVRRHAPDVIYVRGRPYLTGVAGWERQRRGTGFVWASTSEEGCERWKQLRRLWNGPRPLVRKLLRTPPDFIADLIADYGVARADQHVCQTQHQSARLRAVYGREGTVIRSLQVAPSDLPPKAIPPLVLWVGRVAPERSPEAFVDLAVKLSDVDCDFVMVGPPANEAYLAQVLAPTAGLSRFRFVGEVPLSGSWEWIARAAVLVNTSPVEGVSNALVQAWHSGTPTVALHFDPDGIIAGNGVGFHSKDASTMARDVGKIVTDPDLRRAMSYRALALAARELSGESVGAAYEAVMLKAIAHA